MKKIELQTHDDNKVLKLTILEMYGNSSCRCRLEVFSNGFGCDKEVYFDKLIDFIEALESMNQSLNGTAKLQEDYNDHYLKFTLNKVGQLTVEGQILEYSETEQNLEFMFLTDQTCLVPLIEELKTINES